MNRQFKRAALTSFRSAGVFRLMGRSSRRQKQLLILCYHGIALKDEHLWRAALYMSPAMFRRRLEGLRDFRANMLPLAEALVRLRSGTLPDRSVVLTFDDGFADFASQALPLLQQFGYPSTLYLTTFHCDSNVPLFNLVTSYMLAHSGTAEVDISDLGGPPEPVPIETFDQQSAVSRALENWAQDQRLTTQAKDSVAR